MERKPLAIIMPTHNRAECVRYYLERQIEPAQIHHIDVIVFDSSSNAETMYCVREWQSKGYTNLLYRRYDCPNDDMRELDRKVFAACQQFAALYEYLWFSSDGRVLDISGLWDEVAAAMFRKNDIIVLSDMIRKDAAAKKYLDSRELLCGCVCSLTTLGTTIVSAEVVSKAVNRYPPDDTQMMAFWHPLAYFRLFDGGPICAECIGNLKPFEINPMRTDSFWKENGDVLWQWCEVWVDAIYALPEGYDRVKQRALEEWKRRADMFSLKALLGMKAQGQICFRDVCRYRKRIPLVSDTNIFWFYFITLFGNRKLLSAVRKVYRKKRWRDGT